MARVQAFVAVAVLGLLALLLSAAGAEAAPSTACDAHFHATLIVHMCPPISTASPGSDCCHVVLLAAEHGGLPCLCTVAATPRVLVSGIRVEDVIAWYRSCRGEGVTPGVVAAACSAGSPPAAAAARALPAKAEVQQVAAIATPMQPVVTNQYLPAEQWPWYGYVILIAVTGALVFAAIALCMCIGNRFAARLGSVIYWLFDLLMRLRDNAPAPGGELPHPLGREPPRLRMM